MIPLDLSIQAARDALLPLAIFVAGLAVYSLFVFGFYRFLAKKDIFKLDLGRYKDDGVLKKFIAFVVFLFKNILMTPIIVLLWLLILVVLLVFLTKENTIGQILLTSIALISTIRITTYFSEDLARDLAKMLPFTLLGIVLINASYISIEQSIILLKQIPSQLNILVYYFLFALVLEFVLKIGRASFKQFRKK